MNFSSNSNVQNGGLSQRSKITIKPIDWNSPAYQKRIQALREHLKTVAKPTKHPDPKAPNSQMIVTKSTEKPKHYTQQTLDAVSKPKKRAYDESDSTINSSQRLPPSVLARILDPSLRKPKTQPQPQSSARPFIIRHKKTTPHSVNSSDSVSHSATHSDDQSRSPQRTAHETRREHSTEASKSHSDSQKMKKNASSSAHSQHSSLHTKRESSVHSHTGEVRHTASEERKRMAEKRESSERGSRREERRKERHSSKDKYSSHEKHSSKETHISKDRHSLKQKHKHAEERSESESSSDASAHARSSESETSEEEDSSLDSFIDDSAVHTSSSLYRAADNAKDGLLSSVAAHPERGKLAVSLIRHMFHMPQNLNELGSGEAEESTLQEISWEEHRTREAARRDELREELRRRGGKRG